MAELIDKSPPLAFLKQQEKENILLRLDKYLSVALVEYAIQHPSTQFAVVLKGLDPEVEVLLNQYAEE